jgi:hypothetical protein
MELALKPCGGHHRIRRSQIRGAIAASRSRRRSKARFEKGTAIEVKLWVAHEELLSHPFGSIVAGPTLECHGHWTDL